MPNEPRPGSKNNHGDKTARQGHNVCPVALMQWTGTYKCGGACACVRVHLHAHVLVEKSLSLEVDSQVGRILEV